ncbi:MAG: hypothetical protein IKN27_04455 [Selenomonadaceae bacterium]|nr:hypothetical protein [Selenomonadaceae bacterium]
MTINDFDLETFVAYRRLLDMTSGIVCKEKFYEAAKAFVDAYENNEREFELSSFGEQVREFPNSKKPTAVERELPQAQEWYHDIFGNKYMVLSVLSKEISKGKPLIVLMSLNSQTVYTFPLEDFLNPQFFKE